LFGIGANQRSELGDPFTVFAFPGAARLPQPAVTSGARDNLRAMSESALARAHGSAFERVAAEYDRSRPTYPDELVDRACELAGVGRGDPVLELGCGSGQLTHALVARGLQVSAVEPGSNLIELARRRLRGAHATEFVHARFEDAGLPPGRFRAVFCAAAFHWIDPDFSWREVARVLTPGGTLALIGHCGLRDEQSEQDQEMVLSALARTAPEIAATWPVYRDLDATLAGAGERRGNVSELWSWLGGHDIGRPQASRLFEDVQIDAVPVLMEHTAEQLNALLATLSFYQRISPGQRQALERENVAVQARLGRPIRSATVAVLVTARASA
jgi:ubiquinone/menaquinone biosynthesis C-methylase UbiE